MPGFFAHGRGAVQRVPGPHRGYVPFKLWVPGGALNRGIITQGTIEHEGNYQFLHTINDAVYVYVFGDRVGSLVVGGIAFGVPCGGGNGITEVILRYNQHRIAATGNPVIVGFADLAFPCFLTGFNVDTADPETHTAQWALRFNFFPQS